MLRDDDLGAALVKVGDEALKGETVDERSNPHRIEAVAPSTSKRRK